MKFPKYYINGNYQVKLEKDGTKTRTTPDEKFLPKFPETMDVNISNHCIWNCSFCYISASEDGQHGDLNLPIFDQLVPGMEIAINYATHPDLISFLNRMYNKRVIVNITINQKDLDNPETIGMINNLFTAKLIQGLGVSVNNISKLHYLDNDNIVYHVIAGITPISVIRELIKNEKRILILGYKTKGRGEDCTPDFVSLILEIEDILKMNNSIISFDNLALSQLNIKSLVSDSIWKSHYMGEEGQFSMYLDTVTESFFKSSLEKESFEIGELSLGEMFKKVRSL